MPLASRIIAPRSRCTVGAENFFFPSSRRAFWHSWRSRGSPRSLGDGNSEWDGAPVELRQQIPRPTLTVMRKSIRERSNSRTDVESQIMQPVSHEEFEDCWPLSGPTEAPQNVGHSIQDIGS